MLVVPKVILSNVFRMTSTASKMPIHQHWHTQSFVLLNDIINIYIYIYIYIYPDQWWCGCDGWWWILGLKI